MQNYKSEKKNDTATLAFGQSFNQVLYTFAADVI